MRKVRSGEELREYRASYNYRSAYFKQNPGFFGVLWFCSQCYRPLFGRKNVVVDHIVPLSKGGRNHVSNCTAICAKCNRAKSDNTGAAVTKGRIFKLFESSAFRAQNGIGTGVAVGVGLTAAAASATAHTGIKATKTVSRFGFRAGKGIFSTAVRFVTYPLRKGSLVSRLFFIAIYVVGIMYLLSEYTTLLDPWLR